MCEGIQVLVRGLEGKKACDAASKGEGRDAHDGDFDALLLEQTLLLGEEDCDVVRRRLPVPVEQNKVDAESMMLVTSFEQGQINCVHRFSLTVGKKPCQS